MSERINVELLLNVSGDVKVAADDLLELSLNCFICERTRRTIGLRIGEEAGICTPTRHLFPAKILAKEVVKKDEFIQIKYQVEYWFAPFIDRKYKELAEDVLKWGRINFTLTCPNCGEIKHTSVQNNLVRPHTYYCSCDRPLYSETEEYPKFERVAF